VRKLNNQDFFRQHNCPEIQHEVRGTISLILQPTRSVEVSLFTHGVTNTPLTVFTVSESQHAHNQDVVLSSHILKDVVWAALTDNNLKQDDFL
jgi:hypothetical protein